ncbi:MAG: sel1 repeat family protein [Ruminococcaceae bacterium]|nr:sel1 repeat family protein [Oscillospiraceae bacterium]
MQAQMNARTAQKRAARRKGNGMTDLNADFMEGQRLFYLQRYDEAEALLTDTAEAGSARAQHFLAMIYEHGNGVTQDLERAGYWYGRAAAQGDSVAQLTFAMLRALGKGMEPDLADACHWATRAYHQGNQNAAQALSIIRAQAAQEAADAVEAFRAARDAGDEAEALAQLTRAAECGSADAQFALAQLFSEGRGVAQDAVEALFWLLAAAEQEHAGVDQALLDAYRIAAEAQLAAETDEAEETSA